MVKDKSTFNTYPMFNYRRDNFYLCYFPIVSTVVLHFNDRNLEFSFSKVSSGLEDMNVFPDSCVKTLHGLSCRPNQLAFQLPM